MAHKKQTAPKTSKSAADAVTMVEVYKRDAKRIARAKLEGDYRYTRDAVSDLLDSATPKKVAA